MFQNSESLLNKSFIIIKAWSKSWKASSSASGRLVNFAPPITINFHGKGALKANKHMHLTYKSISVLLSHETIVGTSLYLEGPQNG